MKSDRKEKGYSREELYNLIRKNDYVVTTEIRDGSDNAAIYGHSITCVSDYTKKGRDEMMKNSSEGVSTYGKVRAKELIHDISEELRERLLKERIDSGDIFDIVYLSLIPKENTFESKGKRVINNIVVSVTT
jgi:hypothetical protein